MGSTPKPASQLDEHAFGAPKRTVDPGPRGGNPATEALIDGE